MTLTPLRVPEDQHGAMDRLRAFWIVVTAAALWQGVHEWRLRPVHPGDGPIAPLDPVQTDLDAAPPLMHGRWTLSPRAHYDITARILSREDYRFDAIADLVPEDLALGWGPMSDNRVIGALEITQSARFYSWRAKPALPISRTEITEHSANTHVIPADSAIRAQLARLRQGQVVHLSGDLVDGVRDDGASLRTSLTRSDSGAGACEIMLVDSVEVR